MRYILLTRKRLWTAFGLCCILAAGIVLGVQGVVAISASMQQQKMPICSVKTEEKKIALSFDTAWEDGETQALLDVLEEYRVKTSFFVMGKWVDKYPKSLENIAAASHEIAVSYTHLLPQRMRTLKLP